MREGMEVCGSGDLEGQSMDNLSFRPTASPRQASNLSPLPTASRRQVEGKVHTRVYVSSHAHSTLFVEQHPERTRERKVEPCKTRAQSRNYGCSKYTIIRRIILPIIPIKRGDISSTLR